MSSASAASITGTMRDASGDPVAGVTLRAENHSTPEPTITAETASDGSYALSLSPGSYTISTLVSQALPDLPPGWALETAQFSVAGDETRDITLPETVTATVEALGEGGVPIPGAAVDLAELVGSPDLGGYIATDLRSRELTGVTDLDGRLSLVVFDDGNFTEEGSITPPSGSGYGFTRFASPAVAGDTTIVVHPPVSASITGAMRDASGNPVAGVTLRAENHSTPGPTVTAETAVDGSYAFSLVPGNYTVSAFVGEALPGLPLGWALETAQFTVTDDETRDVNLPPTVTVTVEALSKGGAPIPDAGVDLSELVGHADLGGYTATDLRSRELTGATDQNGRLFLPVFDNGTFREEGLLAPTPDSGYEITHFSSPPVSGNTTIVVRPAGKSPVVSGLQPTTGAESGGTEVTITGSRFSGASEVRFGPKSAASFKVVSATSIVAVAPAGSGEVDVTVTTPDGTSGTSAADRFVYVGPPVSLRSSPNPSHRKQKVTFTAKVTPEAAGAPAPQGTVSFVEGSTTLAVVNLKNGTAKFIVKSLKAGKHKVAAIYSGDSSFRTSTSEAIVQVVKPRKRSSKRHRAGRHHRGRSHSA